ncbi:MAG: toxin-activating lysine-acyltransferase [Gallionellaceae bacterium]|nr:toxin-activating lysine-acyltransferase [Gallionellaceae bacterium]
MRYRDYEIIAPGLPEQSEQSWSEAAALGSAVWLWMHSGQHRDAPLHTLSVLLLPAIKRRQFILVAEASQPVFYLSWAELSAEAEQRYLRNSPLLMPEADWHSGERMWLLDWIAPFGHTRAMSRLLERHLFANRLARALYHRGEESGLRVKTFRGIAVPPEEARWWFQQNPVDSGQGMT